MEIKKKLLELQDQEYQKFITGLLPGTKNVIGIRVPKLRELAKTISEEEAINYIKDNNEEYYEDYLLKSILFKKIKDYSFVKALLNSFVLKIDNWAVCDTLVSSLKIINKNKKDFYSYLMNIYKINTEFTRRFVFVCLLNYYVEEEYFDDILKLILKTNNNEYYVTISEGWLIAELFIFNKNKIYEFLSNDKLKDEVKKKAIRKICESSKVSKEDKEKVKSIK